jgi:hypothetical protein
MAAVRRAVLLLLCVVAAAAAVAAVSLDAEEPYHPYRNLPMGRKGRLFVRGPPTLRRLWNDDRWAWARRRFNQRRCAHPWPA